jgi:hypothetical protein
MTTQDAEEIVSNLDAMVARLDLDGVDVDLERGTKFHPEGKLVAYFDAVRRTPGGRRPIVGAGLAQGRRPHRNGELSFEP